MQNGRAQEINVDHVIDEFAWLKVRKKVFKILKLYDLQNLDFVILHAWLGFILSIKDLFIVFYILCEIKM